MDTSSIVYIVEGDVLKGLDLINQVSSWLKESQVLRDLVCISVGESSCIQDFAVRDLGLNTRI